MLSGFEAWGVSSDALSTVFVFCGMGVIVSDNPSAEGERIGGIASTFVVLLDIKYVIAPIPPTAMTQASMDKIANENKPIIIIFLLFIEARLLTFTLFHR